jgi:hypothetical protein
MKKILYTIALAVLGSLVLVMPTLAATTVSLSPASVSVKSGQSFNVSVSVNPQGTNNFVEKVELKYPADMLQVNSFTLNSAWMALTQPGYDLTDNTNGVLMKSAGYPGGLSSATTFGTVSFYAKKAGNGTITVGNNSIAFEANSQSAISGSPVSFTITTPVSAPVIPKTPTTPSPAEVPSVPAEQPTTEQPVEQPVAAAQTSLVATIGGFMTFGTGSVWIGILVGLIILAIIGYVIYILIQRKKQNKFGKI